MARRFRAEIAQKEDPRRGGRSRGQINTI
jgi:hypothetical protein